MIVRRIEYDGCGAVEEVEKSDGPGHAYDPTQTWTRVAIDQAIPGAPKALWHRTLCEGCTEKLIGILDGLRAEAERLKGGAAPRGWP